MFHAAIVCEQTSFVYSATFATAVSSAPALEAAQVLLPDSKPIPNQAAQVHKPSAAFEVSESVC